MKYKFIQDALNSQKLKLNLSIISESEAENNKSFSRADTNSKHNVIILVIVYRNQEKTNFAIPFELEIANKIGNLRGFSKANMSLNTK